MISAPPLRRAPSPLGARFLSNQSYAAPIVQSHNRHRVASAFGSSQSRFITFVEEVFSEVPRYHFHVKSGQLTVLDQEGVELADIANAVTEAAQRAQGIVSKDVLQGAFAVSRMIIIADDELRTVTELPF